MNRLCSAHLNNGANRCQLQPNHTGPHTDGEQQWSDAEPDSLDSNYDIAAREAKDPTPAPAWNAWKGSKATHTPDEAAMRKTFMKKCKPFLPGVSVYTSFGVGVIVDVLNVADDYCPFLVRCFSDGKERMFKRENLTIKATNPPFCICGTVTDVHQHECPLATVPIQQSMQCDIHKNYGGNGPRCILQQGHKDNHDFGLYVQSSNSKLVPLVERKPIQIAVMGINSVFALCNDGTIWQAIGEKPWFKLAAIPQD